MKSLIVYYSKYGAAEKCADIITSEMAGEVTSVNLKNAPSPGLKDFDRIIIGSNVHAGSINKKIRRFCIKNADALLKKETALFLCCLTPEEEAGGYYEKNFPHTLVEHSKVKAVLGGALWFEKMNPVERFMLKKISGTDQNIEKIDNKRIAQFVRDMEA